MTRTTWMRVLVVAVGFVGLWLVRPAHAHDLRPGVLAFTELSPNEYALRFVAPLDSRGDARVVGFALPPGCTQNTMRVRCEAGLAGVLAITGLRGPMKMVVVVKRKAGQRRDWILGARTSRVDLGRSPPAGFIAWLGLGITHILAGFDHLAFVLGLLLVLDVLVDRRLLATITAFTLAHSLTLALAVLGVVHVSASPVEACIALSVLLVAREALHREPTLLRRMPWLAAAAFGLVHGLGFASALRDVGIPTDSLATSLFAFNAGVELGQLAVVIVVVGAVALGRRLVGERRVVGRHIHRTACYALGAMAAWWLLDRVVDLARGGT